LAACGDGSAVFAPPPPPPAPHVRKGMTSQGYSPRAPRHPRAAGGIRRGGGAVVGRVRHATPPLQDGADSATGGNRWTTVKRRACCVQHNTAQHHHIAPTSKPCCAQRLPLGPRWATAGPHGTGPCGCSAVVARPWGRPRPAYFVLLCYKRLGQLDSSRHCDKPV
jgi:hypothetical protein